MKKYRKLLTDGAMSVLILLLMTYERIGAAFMLTGPSTKITNLGAVKIVLGVKNFALYLAFVMLFSLLTGLIVNVIF